MSRAAQLEQAGKAFAAHLPSTATDKQVNLVDYGNRVEVSWTEPDPDDSKRIVRYLVTNATGESDGWRLIGPNGPTEISDAAAWLRQRGGMTPTAPKVTIADIEREIASERYFSAAEGVQGAYHARGGVHPHGVTPSQQEHQTLGLLTFCVLVLRNGFTVTGESACVSPDNFDAELGRKIAREKAIAKLWPLLGFRLRDWLHAGKPVWVGYDEAAKVDPHAWDLLGAVMELPPDAEPAPQPPALSAAELADAIADAAQAHLEARNQERIAQQSLDMATDSRRRRLIDMAEATAAREKAAEKLLQLTTTNVQVQPGPQHASWQDRLTFEQQEVSERLHKLTEFLGSPAFNALPERERYLLEQQHTAMASYASVLTERMDAAGKGES